MYFFVRHKTQCPQIHINFTQFEDNDDRKRVKGDSPETLLYDFYFLFSKNLTTNKTSKCKSYYTSSFTVSRDSRHGNNLIYKRYQNPSNDRLSHLNGLVSTQSSADFLISWVLVLDCLCLGFKRQPVVIGKSR